VNLFTGGGVDVDGDRAPGERRDHADETVEQRQECTRVLFTKELLQDCESHGPLVSLCRRAWYVNAVYF